jgi:hypothetical protein
MPKFQELETKVNEKKKKLDGMKEEAVKDPVIKVKYNLVVLALAKCITEVGDGKKAEDVFSKSIKDFEVSYAAYKKAKDELNAALGKTKVKLKIDVKELDLGLAADGVTKLLK